MLPLYNPTPGKTTGETLNTNGQVSTDVVLLNILIELRVMTEIALGNAGTNSAASLRSDVVNESNNAVI